MRLQSRNRQVLYYSNFIDREPVINDDGYYTGEYQLTYSNPKGYKGVITAARGETEIELFGSNLNYDKVVYADDVNLDIDEFSRLWIDRLPEINGDGTSETPHDYIVLAVRKTLNFVTFAVKRVDVNA